MIDWLRKPHADPTVDLGDRALPLVIRRHPTARRMTLRLAADGSAVQVTVPRWGRSAEAVAFARLQAGWLSEQLARKPQRQLPADGGPILYRGQMLRVTWMADAPRKPVTADGLVRLGGPPTTLAARLQRWLEGEARDLLRADLADYCTKAELPLAPLRLSRARQRWGSCSHDGTIRINWRLVQAPDMVRRSVVAHEVSHLLHFNHSPAFYETFARLFEGDLACANSWLKHEGPGLYSAFG